MPRAPLRDAADQWGGYAPCKGLRHSSTSAAAGTSLPASWRPLARALFSVLKPQYSEEGLCFRSDGFAKLVEALSVASLQSTLEQAAPGSAEALNTSGWGGPISTELGKVVRAVVKLNGVGGEPCFELWDAQADLQEMWVRAVGELDLPDELPDSAKDVTLSAQGAAVAPEVVAPAAAAAVAQAAAAAALAASPTDLAAAWVPPKLPASQAYTGASSAAPAAAWVPPKLPATKPHASAGSSCKWTNLLGDDRQSKHGASSLACTSITGTWLDDWGSETLTLVQSGDRVTATNKYGPTSGSIKGSSISLFGITGTLSSDRKVITWDNGATWTAQHEESKEDAALATPPPQGQTARRHDSQMRGRHNDVRLRDTATVEAWSSSKDHWSPEKEPRLALPLGSLPAEPATAHSDIAEGKGAMPPQSQEDPAGQRCTGQLRAFFPEKGYGFLKCEAVSTGDVWMHVDHILGPHPERLAAAPGSDAVGPTMEFDLAWKNGRPRAVNVTIVEPDQQGEQQQESSVWEEPAVVSAAELAAPTRAASSGNSEEAEMSAELTRLSRALAVLLRHQAERDGLSIRSDGFAKLDEVLSMDRLQELIELVAPGCSQALNTSGWGGEISAELLGAVMEIVAKSFSKGSPRFELWDCDQEVWIRATHKHTLRNVEVAPIALALTNAAHDTNDASEIPDETSKLNVWASECSEYGQAKPCLEKVNETSEETAEAKMSTGQIRTFSPETGYGFLCCDEVTTGDVYFHSNSVIGNLPEKCIGRPGEPPTGQMMEFELQWRNGRPRAVKAQVTACPDSPAQPGATATGDDSTECSAEPSAVQPDEPAPEPKDRKPQVAELLSMLPGDAPDAVRQYLASLAQESC